MKTHPLVGRLVQYHSTGQHAGLRVAYVRAANYKGRGKTRRLDNVSVQHLRGQPGQGTPSARYRGRVARVPLDCLEAVHWHGRLRPAAEWLVDR